MFNVDESGLTDEKLQSELKALVAPAEAIFINAKLEEEMSGMNRDERKEFLESYGVKEDALGELIKAAYKITLCHRCSAFAEQTALWAVRPFHCKTVRGAHCKTGFACRTAARTPTP